MTDVQDLRFIVLQPGARMHYAVPALLARAGMLARLYTDICADVGPIQHLHHLWPDRMRPKSVARLLGRRLPREISPRLVRQVPVRALADRLLPDSAARRHLNGWLDPTRNMMKLARQDEFAGANALYTLLINSDLDLVREARARGISVVHEVMIGPDVGPLLLEEQSRFPDLETPLAADIIQEGSRKDAQKYRAADLIVVPSEFVRRAVLALGADPGRVEIVPYGLDRAWFDQVSDPIPGRTLSVGTVGLRKGNHYLAEAARILRHRRAPCEVRVVGPYSRDMISHPTFRGPHYVGQIPRASVLDEFVQADVFVLPTLCDSFALVHLEAMACGIPVVTTPNCGSVVRDGIDGFIVPIRDAAALAEKIELLVTDRQLRARLGHNARERAKAFTWDRYGERLFAAFGRLQRESPGLSFCCHARRGPVPPSRPLSPCSSAGARLPL